MTNQLTLEDISELLTTLQPEEYKENAQLLLRVVSQFHHYLHVRPFSHTEANELFLAYIQVKYHSKYLLATYKELQEEKQTNKQLLESFDQIVYHVYDINSITWIREMNECLTEIHRLLSLKNYQKGSFNEEKIIELLMDEDLYIEKKEGKTFIHLDDDRYNEFGIEMREEYFKN